MEVYAYKVEMKQKGTLTITDLPFNAGENVEVIIFRNQTTTKLSMLIRSGESH